MTNDEFTRKTAGITAERLAELCGKSKATIESIKSGRMAVPDDVAITAKKIADAFSAITADFADRGIDMMKIIDGRRYNTRTAIFIAERAVGCCGDFRHIYEALYRTKSGVFFVAGQGGPMTDYANYNGNEQSGGRAIRPLTISAAKVWLAEYGTAAEYAAVFGAEEA